MKFPGYFRFWKNEVRNYLTRHKITKTIIYDEKNEPFIKLSLENNLENNTSRDTFHISYFENETWVQEEEITEESIYAKHELVTLIAKSIIEDNNRYKTRYNAYSKVGVSLTLGLLLGGITAGLLTLFPIPFILFSPYLIPILCISGVALATTILSYRQLDKYLALQNQDPSLKYSLRNLKVPKEVYKKTVLQYLLSPLNWLNNAAKWVGRLIVNNTIFKYTIGNFIAFVGNRGNKHYKVDAQT